MFELTDKVMIVTGAGRGIGKSIALKAAQAGADLSIGSRTMSALEEVAEVVRSMGRRCECFPLDVTKVDSINAFVDSTLKAFGRIDVLVNNAGFNKIKPALEITEEEFDYIVDVNLKSVFFMSCAVARHLIARGGGGRIINISSQVGVVGGPLRAPYSGAKGGVTLLTKALAAEWAPHQITVNAVAPTVTRTPMAEKAMENPDFRNKVLPSILLGRLAEPDEIAAAVIYLASDEAGIVTGHTLVVDGGWTAV
ncbi:MAG: 3-oxoacyl-ACP reductase FabG, partial [Abditibacteriales bacterium]|nr:3-oxoacyl-ACP reductase FabG [Abditibacteriales bacterium]